MRWCRLIISQEIMSVPAPPSVPSYSQPLPLLPANKKTREPTLTIDSLLGGGYLLSHFRSTIGVVRLNFSVRNGKRWDPHAITT